MKQIFFFDSMLTPKIITFVYWILLVSAVISGLITMFNGYQSNVFGGLMMMVGGVVGARIWCELMIVLFKIHENLQRIADSKSES
ncbi:DUF4282 domain-containing protein [Alginatibacterium sediminis]|uniref:DUF4282 domain-containing protein n=1 Tax=Alginatibacterium sediminis TaxID=2164068 RepID=A0A420EL70_9ALTE|nr:DUF4282 domain-containing protein [Alginatibacterium sediminis]RKF21481.1 DUF4282 domain-containing protein [Alginatibacterium sediminis]